jgi:hypothetical protein
MHQIGSIPLPVHAFSASYLSVTRRGTMAAIQEKSNNKTARNSEATQESAPPSDVNPTTDSKIDPTAPAGTENSLGAESVRDGRPATDDSTVEAMDEETPDITAP